MSFLKKLFLVIFLFITKSIFVYAKSETLISPNGNVKVVFALENARAGFDVSFNGKSVVRSISLGFVLEGNDSLTKFSMNSCSYFEKRNTWKTVWGQSSEIVENYSELKISLNDLTQNRTLILSLRAYDDGFAFRYEIPAQEKVHIIHVISEESRFALVGKYSCWWSWADYGTLEKQYYHTSLDSAKHVAVPFTLRRNDDVYVSIHEAAIDDYSSMTLKQEEGDANSYKVNLVPWAFSVQVKAVDSLRTPWRAFIFAKKPGDLIESNLILNLNEPCKLEDVSWIKPMNYIGIWWEMHLGISTWTPGDRHGATTENAKRYIDFAAANGIKGVLIEGWNTGWEEWGKKDAFDFVTPTADFDLKDVVEYARSKGVEIIGHHETGGDTESYEKHLEAAFSLYSKLGIHVVKTGYAGSVTPEGELHHGQCMVRHYNKVMRLAAKYHIMLDVHEPIVLSGLSRTYPNLMTAEGVRGMEWNAWSEGNMPSHTATIPFTRGIAGPIDYTPGIFDIDLSAHKGDRMKWNSLDKGSTSVHSTLSNQLALMVVLYSPLQMAADLPENYEKHPAFEFIKNLPTTWDETHVREAAIGEYVTIARRSSDVWYVAGITNEQAREAEIDLSFLPKGVGYTARLCKDAPDADYQANPEAYVIEEKNVISTDILRVTLAPGGGFFLILHPVKK